MALQLRITFRAAAQIERANRWWLANRLAAPDAFVDDLRVAFHLLLRQPGIGTKVANARIEGVRRLHLGRVRYYVFYRVKDGELVVLSVWHSSRGSAPAL
ncbi:type II toxin-antitoxin system RelE/ParE family toxin [Paucibacter oligotrophus]|uniref:type II toxin-antitoxin system RelE/ParE family toxin n=1 Tax=Roseateles oligotrophus TaxID=1769250 RepID=UPI001621A959